MDLIDSRLEKIVGFSRLGNGKGKSDAAKGWKKSREKGETGEGRQREMADTSIPRLKGQISPQALFYFYTGDSRRLQLSTHCALFSKFAAVHFDQVSAAYWIRGSRDAFPPFRLHLPPEE